MKWLTGLCVGIILNVGAVGEELDPTGHAMSPIQRSGTGVNIQAEGPKEEDPKVGPAVVVRSGETTPTDKIPDDETGGDTESDDDGVAVNDPQKARFPAARDPLKRADSGPRLQIFGHRSQGQTRDGMLRPGSAKQRSIENAHPSHQRRESLSMRFTLTTSIKEEKYCPGDGEQLEND